MRPVLRSKHSVGASLLKLAASALSVRLFRILRNWQCRLPACDHFALMTAFCQFSHGSFRFGQPEVHLSRFSKSSVLGMAAELCRAIPVVLSRCDDAHYGYAIEV